VRVKVGDGAWLSAALSGTTPTSKDWSFTATLTTPGTNTVLVKALDTSGNESAVITNFYFWAVPVPLNLVVMPPGSGTVSPPETNLYVGRAYTKTGTPDSGYLFSNWVNSATGVATNDIQTGYPVVTQSVYTFQMESNLVIMATFRTNLFPAVAGVYNGLYWDTNNGVAFESSGYLTIKTDSKLKFSGKMSVEGIKVGFAGTWNESGVGTTKPGKIIARKRKSESFRVVPVLDTSTATLTGTIQKTAGWSAAFEADKVATPPSAALAQQYTMILPNASSNPATEPAGDGYLTVSVTTDKLMIKTKGHLGDGEKFEAWKPVMGQNGEWPFYATQYKDAAKEYKGAVIGWLQFTNAPETNVLGDLTWFKPVTAGGPPPALVGVPYPAYTNQITVVGSLFKPVTAGRVINVPSGNVLIQDGDLGSPITQAFTYDATSMKVLFAKTNNPNQVKLTISGKDGSVKGSFLAIAGDKNSKKMLAGAVLQNEEEATGMFPPSPDQIGSTKSGSFMLPSP
jgi:hypothetical protein